MKILLHTFVICSLLTLLSCGQEEEKYMIPIEPVNFQINTNYQDKELVTPGNTKIFTAARLSGEYVGYSGLLVVCGLTPIDGGTSFQLHAYDLCCPNERIRDVKLTVQDGKAKCPKCGSVYDILSGIGSVESGPSKNGLQRYRVTPDLSKVGIFRITR